MRQYELMMIINPALSDAEKTDLITQIETELAHDGAKIVSTAHPGDRDLAYKIHGSNTGYYLLYTLSKESGNWNQSTNAFNIKTNIWRFMFVRIEE